jgi:hypothetical protein
MAPPPRQIRHLTSTRLLRPLTRRAQARHQAHQRRSKPADPRNRQASTEAKPGAFNLTPAELAQKGAAEYLVTVGSDHRSGCLSSVADSELVSTARRPAGKKRPAARYLARKWHATAMALSKRSTTWSSCTGLTRAFGWVGLRGLEPRTSSLSGKGTHGSRHDPADIGGRQGGGPEWPDGSWCCCHFCCHRCVRTQTGMPTPRSAPMARTDGSLRSKISKGPRRFALAGAWQLASG